MGCGAASGSRRVAPLAAEREGESLGPLATAAAPTCDAADFAPLLPAPCCTLAAESSSTAPPDSEAPGEPPDGFVEPPPEKEKREALGPEERGREALRRGLRGDSPRARLAALARFLVVLRAGERAGAPASALLGVVAALLRDAAPEVREAAAAAAVEATQAAGLSLPGVLEHVYSATVASGVTAASCRGACCFLTPLLEQGRPRGASEENRVHLQAALGDFAPLLRQGLSGELGPEAEEEAAVLAVAVYLHLGVAASSQLLEGLEASKVSWMFEQFMIAEEAANYLLDEELGAFDCSPRTLEGCPRKLMVARSTFTSSPVVDDRVFNELLQEVGLGFQDCGEKLPCSYGGGKWSKTKLSDTLA